MKFEAEKKKTILGRVSESFHLVYRFKSPNNEPFFKKKKKNLQTTPQSMNFMIQLVKPFYL